MKVTELRGWIEDALARQDRDAKERNETSEHVTVDEVVDAVWGRLPLDVRRQSSKSQVQASLTMITLRHAFAAMPRHGENSQSVSTLPSIEP